MSLETILTVLSSPSRLLHDDDQQFALSA